MSGLRTTKELVSMVDCLHLSLMAIVSLFLLQYSMKGKGEFAFLWNTSVYTGDDSVMACEIYIDSDGRYINYNDRYYGACLRGVL